MEYGKVEDEYKKYPKLQKSEVIKLMQWLEQQPHLPNISEYEMSFFLYSCHYSVELAKQTLDTYFTTRTHCPEFFGDRDPLKSDMERIMNVILAYPLPENTPEGFKVYIGKLIDFNLQKFSFQDGLKWFTMVFETILLQQGSEVGYIVALDMNNFSFGHFTRLNPLIMKKFLFYLQEATPIRIQGIHLINAVSFVDKILAMMKPFLKKELLDVIHIHTTNESFYKFVPREILPVEYGGNLKNMEESYKNLCENVKKCQQYFIDDQVRKANERLRPGRPKTSSDLFGAEGSFKTLSID